LAYETGEKKSFPFGRLGIPMSGFEDRNRLMFLALGRLEHL